MRTLRLSPESGRWVAHAETKAHTCLFESRVGWRVATRGAPIGLPEDRMRCLSCNKGWRRGSCQPRVDRWWVPVAGNPLAAPLAIFKGLTIPQSLLLRADR